jgi:hypothetical protein
MDAAHALPPSRIWFEGAAAPFIVHGHRLSSLYRAFKGTQIPFIVLKILKNLCLFLDSEFEYLSNNEAGGSAEHA